MIEFGLKPCPLCGGEPEVARLTQGPEELTAVIKCTECGLTLDWETDVRVGTSRTDGRKTVVKVGLDPIEAWNRRHNHPCENCGHKIYSDRVAAMNDCNNCGAADCEYQPRIGEAVRINCPLWRAKNAQPQT